MDNPRVKLTLEQFNAYECHYPSNLVIVQMEAEKELLTPSGIKLNFNEDVQYGTQDGTDTSSHIADVCQVFGTVVKQVERLYYNRKDTKRTASWDTDIETIEGDIVWTHPLAAKNCPEIIVNKIVYKVLNYEDLFVAKRTIWLNKWEGTKQEVIVPLNGNVILKTLPKDKLSDLDVLEPAIDLERGIVMWNGSDNRSYQSPQQADLVGLKEGDLVAIQKGCYPFYLERSIYNSHFDGANQYFVVQKRYLLAVLEHER